MKTKSKKSTSEEKPIAVFTIKIYENAYDSNLTGVVDAARLFGTFELIKLVWMKKYDEGILTNHVK